MNALAEEARSRAQIAWRNVRANRGWRPADMLNWHRMVRPLRLLAPMGGALDMYQLVYDLCTRLEVQYQPRPQHPPIAMRPRERSMRSPNEPRVGLFVDAPDHLSGVCLTLTEWAAEAACADRDLVIHGCGNGGSGPHTTIFPPMGTLQLRAYEGLRLNVPHVAQVLQHLRQDPFDVIHLSTPGPMGMLGLLVAREAGLPVCGTYHTDFPSYARVLTGDLELEETGWRFMQWFYGQLDRIAAPTPSIRDELVARGLPAERIDIVGRGVDTSRFSPCHRDTAWRSTWGARQSIKLLYVGRVSREKNLPLLAEAFRLLARRRRDVCLVVVGDGPYRDEMQSALHGLPVHFPGVLEGRALAAAYASCDLFVFPSETDTFGRVVLEAQASGLPVLVAKAGGPKDAMRDGATGRIVSPMTPAALADAIHDLAGTHNVRATMGRAALRLAASRTPRASFDAFWNMHRRVHAANRQEVAV